MKKTTRGALQLRRNKLKMNGLGVATNEHPSPNHSEPVREVRQMADASQYSDSAPTGKTEQDSNTWKSLGDLARALVERAAGK
jgi:hypothetical protein